MIFNKCKVCYEFVWGKANICNDCIKKPKPVDVFSATYISLSKDKITFPPGVYVIDGEIYNFGVVTSFIQDGDKWVASVEKTRDIV